MDTNLIDYELGFNIHLGLSKAQRLMTHESAMTHAMVLTAVHVVDEKAVRWRVQNSWGEGSGSKGWFVMSDRWMDEFVYQAVVDPKYDVLSSHLGVEGTLLTSLLDSSTSLHKRCSNRRRRCKLCPEKLPPDGRTYAFS